MSFIELLGWSAVVLVGLFVATWVVSLAKRDSGLADVTWGLAFVACAWLALALAPDGASPRRWLVAGIVSAWGVRLAAHVWLRGRGKPEDPRYAKWRTEAAGASWWWRSLFTVFLLQAALSWIIAVPLVATISSAQPERPAALAWVGLVLALAGVIFESVADAQLQRFRADPANAGKVYSKGLWSTSRHPNYFGEAVTWWGLWLVAVAAGAAWTVFAPVLITVLLLRVSGVTLLESRLREVKPGYAEYVATTSAFVPWFPRRKRGAP